MLLGGQGFCTDLKQIVQIAIEEETAEQQEPFESLHFHKQNFLADKCIS